MRTERYRYTEWKNPNGKTVEVELYDHQKDPAENINIAKEPDRKQLVVRLSAMLDAGWRNALPSTQVQ